MRINLPEHIYLASKRSPTVAKRMSALQVSWWSDKGQEAWRNLPQSASQASSTLLQTPFIAVASAIVQFLAIKQKLTTHTVHVNCTKDYGVKCEPQLSKKSTIVSKESFSWFKSFENQQDLFILQLHSPYIVAPQESFASPYGEN